jgi:hypothetical protein
MLRDHPKYGGKSTSASHFARRFDYVRRSAPTAIPQFGGGLSARLEPTDVERNQTRLHSPQDFAYDSEHGHYICRAGAKLNKANRRAAGAQVAIEVEVFQRSRAAGAAFFVLGFAADPLWIGEFAVGGVGSVSSTPV